MRVVIDLQGAQASHSRRDIGRYSLTLTKALVRNRGEHEIILVLSGLVPESIEFIRAACEGLLPQDNIRVWDAPGPVDEFDSTNRHRRLAAESIRETFLASQNPDIVLVTSLFEGLGDDAVSSLGRHLNLPTAVVLYDLMPLIHRQTYLSEPAVESWYLGKLDHLKRADLLLSVSVASGREAVDCLGFERGHVTNISMACDSYFVPTAVTEAQRQHLREVYRLDHPFVMHSGVSEQRESIEGVIRAYARLPRSLRQVYRLVVVGSFRPSEQSGFERLARDVGLEDGELVMTGFVHASDLLTLYNASKLFVFAGGHEGFGLSALEAMQCGKAVIAANTSGLSEVVGRDDALFEPCDESGMATKLERVLSDEAFRHELERHSLQQAKRFGADDSARRALVAMEQWHSTREVSTNRAALPRGRPRLAYVSPMPPTRSGISDYSAELLQELTRWYEIDVVVEQSEVLAPWVKANCGIRDVRWFRENHRFFDRVLYHFGNSEFHRHMFGLLEEIPGVVVLHDFFLSNALGYRDSNGGAPHVWVRELQTNHGYSALVERYTASDIAEVAYTYPCNLSVLQTALGVIVHSEASRDLANAWYGEGTAAEWAVIPHLREPLLEYKRDDARSILDLSPNAFVICSFGMLGPTKLNHRLLQSFLNSSLARDPFVHLLFVGENSDGDYGWEMAATIRDSGLEERISITGWVESAAFSQYLAAADMGVQLRSHSRGETSAAVLDCMKYGLATVVNGYGSMKDLDEEGVWMLPDEFSDEQLIDALVTLHHDAERRAALGSRARDVIRTEHAPRACAERYGQIIERFYETASSRVHGLLKHFGNDGMSSELMAPLAGSLARSFPPSPRRRQILVDVSELVQRDARSGIQRVTRSILKEWLLNPPRGWAVEPVYATEVEIGYRYARGFTSEFLGVSSEWAVDEPVEAWQGDIFLGLDLQVHCIVAQQGVLKAWKDRGVDVRFVVYDLLLELLSNAFPEGEHNDFRRWLEVITRFDGAVCISRAVADDLRAWLESARDGRERGFSIDWFHLGADIENSSPTKGLPDDAYRILSVLRSRPTFLMVGTIEPRKKHEQVLAAFELLWAEGREFNLAIVGKQGWMVGDFIRRLGQHSELGKRLFWLNGISDEYLEHLYAESSCLIAASEGEGFGLPLIEAAQHELPIIARDIPVFREVAGEHAFYFDGLEPGRLAQAIRHWIGLYEDECAPDSRGMEWQTWKESARSLLSKLIRVDETEPNRGLGR